VGKKRSMDAWKERFGDNWAGGGAHGVNEERMGRVKELSLAL